MSLAYAATYANFLVLFIQIMRKIWISNRSTDIYSAHISNSNQQPLRNRSRFLSVVLVSIVTVILLQFTIYPFRFLVSMPTRRVYMAFNNLAIRFPELGFHIPQSRAPLFIFFERVCAIRNRARRVLCARQSVSITDHKAQLGMLEAGGCVNRVSSVGGGYTNVQRALYRACLFDANWLAVIKRA